MTDEDKFYEIMHDLQSSLGEVKKIIEAGEEMSNVLKMILKNYKLDELEKHFLELSLNKWTSLWDKK